ERERGPARGSEAYLRFAASPVFRLFISCALFVAGPFVAAFFVAIFFAAPFFVGALVAAFLVAVFLVAVFFVASVASAFVVTLSAAAPVVPSVSGIPPAIAAPVRRSRSSSFPYAINATIFVVPVGNTTPESPAKRSPSNIGGSPGASRSASPRR